MGLDTSKQEGREKKAEKTVTTGQKKDPNDNNWEYQNSPWLVSHKPCAQIPHILNFRTTPHELDPSVGAVVIVTSVLQGAPGGPPMKI